VYSFLYKEQIKLYSRDRDGTASSIWFQCRSQSVSGTFPETFPVEYGDFARKKVKEFAED